VERPVTAASEGQRLDKWLWHARFAKTRDAAARLCESGRLRLGRDIVSKPHRLVRVGDILTFPAGRQIRTVKVAALTARRGSVEDARRLYEDLAPPTVESALPSPLGYARRP
jgi:ribosome-associated heat shock protein Hsp15